MKRILPFILLIVIVSSCKYEKLLKSRDYRLKYDKALEYYANEDYIRAEGLFEQLKPMVKGTKQADTVFFYAAYCSYYQNSFLLAGHYFDEFRKTFGNSPFVEEAEFMNAYSNYKLSPRISLDQSSSYQTISLLSLYLSRYPNSERKAESLRIINELKNKLVQKAYKNAKLYFDLSDYKAAIVALNTCLDEYPDSDFREEIMYMILRSKYLLAENSVIEKQTERYQSTVDEYYAFNGEFPESDYKKEVQDMFENSQAKLKN